MRYAHETAREVETEYVSKGLVKVIFMDFALHGEAAVTNAEAAQCANDQSQFWAYHDLLYETPQNSEESRRFSTKQLKDLAQQLKLDQTSFDRCLDTHKYRPYVIAAYDEGRRMGFKVVPTLMINQRIVEGFLPFDDLKPIIEQELDKVK